MLLNEIKKRINERSVGQILDIDQAIDMITDDQRENPSVANELMIESLRYRRQKVEREATGVISR